jgi:hypothetical protein
VTNKIRVRSDATRSEPLAALAGDARRKHPGRKTARLEDDDLAVPRKSAVEENLRDLRGLSRAGRCLEDQPVAGVERVNDGGFEFVDWQVGFRHGRALHAGCGCAKGTPSHRAGWTLLFEQR